MDYVEEAGEESLEAVNRFCELVDLEKCEYAYHAVTNALVACDLNMAESIHVLRIVSEAVRGVAAVNAERTRVE